jgi:hypothetical protein
VWTERGTLRLGRYQGPASRTLRIVSHGDGWLVLFADGRPFHRLDLSGGRTTVTHPCGDDVYEGEYAIRGPGELDVIWRVRGPAKDQRIASRYRRG